MVLSRRGAYAACAVGLFLLEVLIATKLAHLAFVRSSLGDVLATMLLYFALLALVEVERVRLAAAVFAVACLIEASQALHLAEALGLPRGSALRIMLGDSFAWADIVCYLVGCVLALGLDRMALRKAG